MWVFQWLYIDMFIILLVEYEMEIVLHSKHASSTCTIATAITIKQANYCIPLQGGEAGYKIHGKKEKIEILTHQFYFFLWPSMTINHIYYDFMCMFNHASCILIVCLFFHARKSLQECEHAQMHALLGGWGLVCCC